MTNTKSFEEDIEETARLILLDVREIPGVSRGVKAGFGIFVERMRAECGRTSLLELKGLYTKYMGFDGREAATHDIETGESFVRLRLLARKEGRL